MVSPQQLLLLPALLYSAFILYLIYKAIRFPQKATALQREASRSFSLVIPCRNEAHNLPGLLESIDNQLYSGAMEIIIVDDRSTDNTAVCAQTIAATMKIPVQCIPSNYDPATPLTGKQQALDRGIRVARFDWILLTDADMSFSPHWVQSFNNSIGNTTDLAYGHTAIKPSANLFTLLQSLLLEFLFAVAAVFHFAGIAGSCMGNNLLINKHSYLRSGGFNATGYTITEDRAMLNLFFRLGYSIALVTPFHPLAFTRPHTSFGGFLDQIIRWAKGGVSSGKNLLLISLLFSLQNISFILIFFLENAPVFSTVIILNVLCTWILVSVLFHKQKAPVSSLFFPLFYVLMVLGTLYLPVAIVTKRELIWKGSPV